MDKYIKLSHFEELMRLYKNRDRYMDWQDEYEKYDEKITKTIKWIKLKAKTREELQ